MTSKYILLIGSIIVIGFVILWQLNIIGEPIAALASAGLTSLAYFLSIREKDKSKKTSFDEIHQENTGGGDNIGGRKINLKKNQSFPFAKKNSTARKITQIHKGDGDNIADDKIDVL